MTCSLCRGCEGNYLLHWTLFLVPGTQPQATRAAELTLGSVRKLLTGGEKWAARSWTWSWALGCGVSAWCQTTGPPFLSLLPKWGMREYLRIYNWSWEEFFSLLDLGFLSGFFLLLLFVYLYSVWFGLFCVCGFVFNIARRAIFFLAVAEIWSANVVTQNILVPFWNTFFFF